MLDLRKYLKKDGKEKKATIALEDYKRKIWFHKKKKVILLCIGVLILFILVGMGIIYQSNLTYDDFRVLSVSKLENIENSKYSSFGEYIIRYSMDGISCMDKNGNAVWERAYEIKTPIIDICKDFVVVAAQRGNNLYIFNKAGFQGEIVTQYPILRVTIAAQGVVAVVMEDGGMNYVRMYDVAGTELVGKKSSLEGEGYPFDIALSENGQKLIVSALNMKGGTIYNSLDCYNFSGVGQNYIEQLVAAFGLDGEFGDSLIPEVEFLNENIFCAFSDSEIYIYEMKEIPELKQTITLDQTIKTIFYNDKYIGLILNTEEVGAKGRLCVYDLSGKLMADELLEQDYKDIFFAENTIIMYNDYSMTIFTISGRVKFKYTFDKDIILMKRISETRYVWVSSSSISEIKLN